MSTLGYTHTAKCYECHGHHEIKRVADEDVDNAREQPPRNLPRNVTRMRPKGFDSRSSRMAIRMTSIAIRSMWVASKFMIRLLAGVFIFFWTHAALWFYRENKDRKEGKNKRYVQMDETARATRGRWQIRQAFFGNVAPGTPYRRTLHHAAGIDGH